jgi:hypothetical protein
MDEQKVIAVKVTLIETKSEPPKTITVRVEQVKREEKTVIVHLTLA